MPGSKPLTPPTLLNDLYQGAVNPGSWQTFLHRLAESFHCETATLRLTDTNAPLVHTSYTVGFDPSVNQLYHQGAAAGDPFRSALAEGPLGVVHGSHEILPDRDFAATEFYQKVFRPNGNFYAMGAQFYRAPDRSMHLGVHRSLQDGPFSPREREALAFFTPHLRRAADICQLVGEFESALTQARSALDQLPFAVWLMDSHWRCQWMNFSARELVSLREFGLTLSRRELGLSDGAESYRLRQALMRVRRGGSSVESVPLGELGASLLILDCRETGGRCSLSGFGDAGFLVFLMDPHRAMTLNEASLRARYGLTPAELRLASVLLRGCDLGESSHALGISIHTARTQLKSIMQKMGVSRQAELLRVLLMGFAILSPTVSQRLGYSDREGCDATDGT
ncbi:MAG: helix-turn-helix transcriptional regulator [Oleiphilaceae bacterium]|nr:helix-turn-helix transcriptional regulator [Oleiphilaceae bacterium]